MFLLLLLSGCGGAQQPYSNNGSASGSTISSLQVNENGASTNTVAEPIYLNNCGNSSSVEQVSERSQTISIEGTAELGVSIDFIKASVAGKYTTSKSIRKSHTVTASPDTNMKFILLWTEQINQGTVTVEGYSKQATYRVNVPISVEQASAEKLSCPNSPASQTSSENATKVPTARVPPTSIPTQTPVQDTPNGTILEPGMAWYKNGKSIRLNDYGLTQYAVANSEAVQIEWIVENISNHDISIKFTEDSFDAKNSVGERASYKRFYQLPYGGNGATITFTPGKKLIFSMDLWVPYSNPSVNMVTISVSLSDIQNARWNIPIYH
jgi:hypothetical protein